MLLEYMLKTTFSFSVPNAPFSQSLSHICSSIFKPNAIISQSDLKLEPLTMGCLNLVSIPFYTWISKVGNFSLQFVMHLGDVKFLFMMYSS